MRRLECSKGLTQSLWRTLFVHRQKVSFRSTDIWFSKIVGRTFPFSTTEESLHNGAVHCFLSLISHLSHPWLDKSSPEENESWYYCRDCMVWSTEVTPGLLFLPASWQCLKSQRKTCRVASDKVAWSERLKMTVSLNGGARPMSPSAILWFENIKHFLKKLFLNVVVV